MLRLVSGIYMGWALGSNDSSNIFGTAVASKAIRFWHAVSLCAVFVIAGSLLEGYHGLQTLGNLTTQTINTAFIASLASAITVTLMTILKLPVSTSQAMIGAILGIGIFINKIEINGLGKVLICWLATPLGAAIVAVILYIILGKIIDALPINIFTRDRLLKIGLILAGCYGAYALGANNVANVTGVYAASGLITPFYAVLIGGISIAVGALTYSRNVMMTVGKKLVVLDPFSAFIAVLSEAITVHIFAIIGVPVSTSQAIIGAVLGIGILKGMQTINIKTLILILFGWIGTPAVALLLAFIMQYIFL